MKYLLSPLFVVLFLNSCGDRGTETVSKPDIVMMPSSEEEVSKSGDDWNKSEANDTVEKSENSLSEKELTKNKPEEWSADSHMSL